MTQKHHYVADEMYCAIENELFDVPELDVSVECPYCDEQFRLTNRVVVIKE